MFDHSKGFDASRLDHLRDVIRADVADRRYFGGAFAVARHGKLAVHEAFGHADAERRRPVEIDSVFSLFSVTKAITNTLVFRAIELGQFALTTKVSEIIREFSGGMREDITFFDLLTHTSGMPSVYSPRPGMAIDTLAEIIAAIAENVHGEVPAGTRVDYSPMVNHALMGEAVRRTDPKGRSYGELVQQEIFDRLNMKDSSVGRRADLAPRHLVPDFRGLAAIEHRGKSDLGPNGAFEEPDAEMPWVGVSSTISDMFRFTDMLRRGGEMDGVRILGPRILELARLYFNV